MLLNDKLKARRLEIGLTMADVAKAVGVSEATVSRWESGDINNMKRDRIAQYATALRVSPMFIMGMEDEEPLPLPSNAYPADMSDMVQIPILGNVAAGLACHCDDNIIGYELVDRSIMCSGEDYVYLRVKGDSMSPKLEEGDLVLIRCQPSVDSGDYAVVIVDGEDGLVKQVKYDKDSVTLISANPYYPPRMFEGEGEISRLRVFGKVVESKRKF